VLQVISQLLEAENFFGYGLKSPDRGRARTTLSRGGDFLPSEEAIIEHGGQGVAVHVATV